MYIRRVFVGALASVVLSFAAAPLAFAFALPPVPDGASGPWADSVVSFVQGTRKDGSPVLASRSDTSQVLGISQSNGSPVDDPALEGTFLSLGFGGVLVLHFDNGVLNGPGNDLQIFEDTFPSSPDERVKIETSVDGITWTLTNPSFSVRDGSVDLGSLSCVQFVRLTDISDMSLFNNDADGYDVDAVRAIYTSSTGCPTPEPAQACQTSEIFSAFYFSHYPNQRPGGTVFHPYVFVKGMYVSTQANSVNLALSKSLSPTATPEQVLLADYLSLQMSISRNGGFPADIGILKSALSCWSTWPGGSYNLSNGHVITGDTAMEDFLAEMKDALISHRTADYSVLIGLFETIGSDPY